MPLNSQVQKYLQQTDQLQLPPITSLDPSYARELNRKLRSKPLNPIPVAQVEECLIPSLDGEIRLRIYTPEGNGNFPLLVYFHGGGWVLGDLDSGDPTCRALAKGVGCVVISVDYRLAPEYKFPVAVEDAYTAVLWVAENAENLQGDRTRLAIIGDSAGGNLAAVVALMAKERKTVAIAYQVLIYPVTQHGFDTPFYHQYGQPGFGLTREEMIWFWNQYLTTSADGLHPHASPLFAHDLTDLPPALIIAAECDPLRDDAHLYAQKLQAAGVVVEYWEYPGMIHSFVGLAAVLDDGKKAIADIITQLQISF
jgi:acetyl esterase